MAASNSKLVYNSFTDNLDYTGTGGSGPSTDLHVSRFIVSPGGSTDGANYTTIASAYAAAIAAGGPQTVFVQDGTYTENLTLHAGIDITSFDCDDIYGNPNVIIKGKLTATYSGAVSLSGLCLDTNGDYCIEITGSNGTGINLIDCQIRAIDHSTVHLNSSGEPGMSFFGCTGNIYGNYNFFTCAQGGSVNIYNGVFAQASGTPTSDTFNSVSLNIYNCLYSNPITMSGSGNGIGYNNSFGAVVNTTLLTINNTTDQNNISNSRIESGTASAISIGVGSTAIVAECQINSNNANAITGLGTLKYGHLTFTGSSSTVNTSTATALPVLPASGSSPLTTKGDIFGFSTADARIPVGVDGYVFTADSGAPEGVSWQPPSGGGTSSGFFAYLSSNLSNVTGNGVIYDIILDSTLRNDGGVYNTSTGQFTADKTGLWSFQSTVLLENVSNSTVLAGAFKGSVITEIFTISGNGSIDGFGSFTGTGAITIPMTAGDTLNIQVYSNESTQTVTVGGDAITAGDLSGRTSFSGFFVGSSSGSGDVSGPVSSTDRSISTWNGTSGDTLFDNPTVKIDSDGVLTNITQPCFYAYLSNQASNVTGDGTVYQIAFDGVALDQSSSFTPGASAHFTAPKTGNYMFTYNILCTGISAQTFAILTFTSNFNTVDTTFKVPTPWTGAGDESYSGSILVPMTAGDTAYLSLNLGGSTKTVSVTGAALPVVSTFFSGYLVC